VGSLGLTAVAAGLLAACGTDRASVDTPPPYRDVSDLFDRGVARTCSLNNGVCHNSNTYPDLHTIANLVDTVDRPCNVETTDRAKVNDVCEPPADHLVIPSAGIDARIATAALAPDELDRDATDLTQITLVLDPAPAGLTVGAADTQIVRGTTIFRVGDYGAVVKSVDGASVILDLTPHMYGEWTAKRFFDVRVWPPGSLHLHVGDPNGNGIQGALVHTMPLIAPGDPDNSYLLKRLVDESYGERMPRQCRTWDDNANQALACWIAGLTHDAANAYDPIDYQHCTISVDGLGKCETVTETGFPAVETLFGRSCAGNGCHVDEAAPAAGLDLSTGHAYASLVGVASSVVAGKLRVQAGSPDASYLMCKLRDDCTDRTGARMPMNAPPLAEAELDTIRAWIASGAPAR
jgi:hypothetical protein